MRVTELPDVFVELRKRFPLAALELVVGTDVHVLRSGQSPDGRAVLSACVGEYKPNLHVSCRDRVLGGSVGLNSKLNELSYTKMLEVGGLELGVSGMFNYATGVPYAGFVLHSAPGLTAKVGAFCINHTVHLEHLPVETHVSFQGEVALPGTRFDAKSGSMGLTGPIDLRFNSVTTTLYV